LTHNSLTSSFSLDEIESISNPNFSESSPEIPSNSTKESEVTAFLKHLKLVFDRCLQYYRSPNLPDDVLPQFTSVLVHMRTNLEDIDDNIEDPDVIIAKYHRYSSKLMALIQKQYNVNPT